MVPYIQALRTRHPDLNGPHSDAPRGARFVERTVGEALRDLYNPAQLDVLQRAHVLIRDGR